MWLIAGFMLKNINVRESQAIVIRDLGRLTFSRKTCWQMFLNLMLQSKEFNRENFNTLAINLERHALKQELHGGNHVEISVSKSTGKYAKTVWLHKDTS